MHPLPALVNGLMVAGALAMAAVPVAAQQDFPNRPIRFIVPNAPGGSTSAVARLVGEQMTADWGEQVIIDNRPGGNNIIAGETLQRGEPDGHTILLVTAAHAINPLLHSNPKYKTFVKFPAVGTLVSTNYILVVNAQVPAKDLEEFIALAKSKPGQLNGAVSNAGGIQHLALEMFNVVADVKLQAIPYKGGGPGMIDLVAGQVQFAFNNSITTMPHIKSGKIRPLGIGGDSRLDVLPDVPTFAEVGLDGYDVKNWFGVVAPMDTPRRIIDALAKEIQTIQKSETFKTRLGRMGVDPFIKGPDDFAAYIQSEMAKYDRIIKAANIKLES